MANNYMEKCLYIFFLVIIELKIKMRHDFVYSSEE